jgi:putative zinc finger/helix-turn-helix YgiT family protein
MGVALKKCLTCRQRAVSSTILPSYSTEMEHDGRKYHVEVPEFAVHQCSNCQTILFDDDANDRLFDALRSAAGLLSPSEIRRQREALGLKQKDLANLLQLSESTLSRWETGAQMQQRCMDKFLRGFFAVEELRRFFGMSGSTPSAFLQQPFVSPPSAIECPFPTPPVYWSGLVEIDTVASVKSSDPKPKLAA